MNKYKLVYIILISTIFGLAGGAVGALMARVYLLEDEFNIPLFGEINVSNQGGYGSSLIIQGAKKVVVEQNTKVADTVVAVKSGLVGIFPRIATSSINAAAGTSTPFDVSDYYQLNNESGQGFIITSDGWIMSSYIPLEYKNLPKDEKARAKAISKIADSYVIIDSEAKVHLINNIVVDELTRVSFYQIKANDLPVKKFNLDPDTASQLVLAVSWDNYSWLTTLIGQKELVETQLKSSDQYLSALIPEQAVPKQFVGSFVFNLSSELLAFINDKGQLMPVGNYLSCINCLLSEKEIKRPVLGVNYINLSQLAKEDQASKMFGALITADTKGVAVLEDSPAERVGLRAGDTIISVNNIELKNGNTLNKIISRFSPGDEIDIIYLRDNQRHSVSIVLAGE
ncbi:PDZ domain-containing protein [Candidatus Parcubacteria bacterium]|nr:PDZ domain-containing protein [Candidatus Parcubacteria bacterium]